MKTRCVMLTAFVDNQGQAASLPEMTCLLFVKLITLYISKYSLNKDFITNLHSTKRHVKHMTNFKCDENVSLNVFGCKCELRRIPK